MRKILIINRLGIGDVVVTTPLAQIIKEHMEAQVGYVVAAKAADLLVNHPYIDDVFAYSKENKHSIIREIKAKGYEEAITIDERLSSTLVAWRADCKLLNHGFEITMGKQRLFTRKNRELQAIDDFSSYSKLLEISGDKGVNKAIIGRSDPAQEKNIASWLEEIKVRTKKIVLIVARTAFDHKNWNVEHLAAMNKYLNAREIIPVYIGSKADDEYIEAIGGDKINIAGKFGLRDLPEIARHASFAISMCTGPLHILATTDIPIIALYGPSDPERWAPKSAIVVQSKLPCVPCLRWADCQQAKGDTCMDEILPEWVEKIIEREHFLD